MASTKIKDHLSFEFELNEENKIAKYLFADDSAKDGFLTNETYSEKEVTDLLSEKIYPGLTEALGEDLGPDLAEVLEQVRQL